MKLRKGENETFKKLYEQEGLCNLLKVPRSRRPTYISFVVRIPSPLKEKLILDALDCVNGCDAELFYVQKSESLHLTYADIGPANSLKIPLNEIVHETRQYISKISGKDFRLEVTELSIGSSGINCEVRPISSEVEEFIIQLQKIAHVKELKGLKGRSISLVRYLIPNPACRLLIREKLLEVARVNYDYSSSKEIYPERFFEFSGAEFHLVRLDKVADFFDILCTFSVK